MTLPENVDFPAATPLRAAALEMLSATSRTFLIPVSRLPAGLFEAVASAYLCLRAIDEIEDHPTLEMRAKSELLRQVSRSLLSSATEMRWDSLLAAMKACNGSLPVVTARLPEWVQLAPESIAPRIWDATAAMADRMAGWAEAGWKIQDEADLDRYTFGVAGAVGLLLSDLWAWYDGTPADRFHAIGFGRGLQAVNILRNRAEDLERGVDFFPPGWDEARMHAYARGNLGYADAYIYALPPGPALEFCKLPLALAHATLAALAQGRSKLSRSEVMQLVEDATK